MGYSISIQKNKQKNIERMLEVVMPRTIETKLEYYQSRAAMALPNCYRISIDGWLI